MKPLIKNLSLVYDYISKEDIEKMQEAATLHRRHSNITFKIVEFTPKKVIIQVVQEKSAAENYFTLKRLIQIVHETFDRFFPGKVMHVHATPFNEPAANKVDAKWINRMMTEKGVKANDISNDTGIDKTQLTSLITGNRTLSQPMKALFWYYFLANDQKP